MIKIGLLTICGYLHKMDRPQIQQLGGELGLSVFNLQMMLNIPGDMVTAWLRKQDDVKEKSGYPLTWKALVDALKRIGQQGIADDIFKDKCNHGNLKAGMYMNHDAIHLLVQTILSVSTSPNSQPTEATS